jgi:hypothetical protein
MIVWVFPKRERRKKIEIETFELTAGGGPSLLDKRNRGRQE